MHLIQLLIRCLWCFVCLCLSSLSVRLLSWTTTGCTSDRTVRLVALELSPSLHWPYAWWSWVTILNSYAGVSGDHPRRSRQFQWWWPPGHDAECQVVIKSNATRCSPTGSIWDLEKWLVDPSRNHKSPGLLEIFLQRADSRIGGVTWLWEENTYQLFSTCGTQNQSFVVHVWRTHRRVNQVLLFVVRNNTGHQLMSRDSVTRQVGVQINDCLFQHATPSLWICSREVQYMNTHPPDEMKTLEDTLKWPWWLRDENQLTPPHLLHLCYLHRWSQCRNELQGFHPKEHWWLLPQGNSLTNPRPVQTK